MFEINGTSRPNTFRKDVVAFNANGLGSACALEIDGKCFGAPFSPTPMTYAECAGENATFNNNTTEAGSYAKSLGIDYCYYKEDYWAGAVRDCGGTQNMPTMEELGMIASLLYEGNPSVGALQYVEDLTYNGKASELGLPEPDLYLWSGEEDGATGRNAYFREFCSNHTYWYSRFYRGYSTPLGLCIAE